MTPRTAEARAKLLKSLLAEKQQLAQQVASLQKRRGGEQKAVYWRRMGQRSVYLMTPASTKCRSSSPGWTRPRAVAARLQSRGLPEASRPSSVV